MRQVAEDFIKTLEKKEYIDFAQEGGAFSKTIYISAEAPTDAEELAETYALNFMQQTKDGAATYSYQPIRIMPNESDEMREFPSRTLVTEEMVEYWLTRAKVTTNKQLKHRYADLVFDFTDVKANSVRWLESARLSMETAYLLDQITNRHTVKQYISRGMYLSKVLNDAAYQQKFIDLLIKLCEQKSEFADFTFSKLINDKKWKSDLTPEQIDKVVNAFDSYVISTFETDSDQPYGLDDLAIMLAKYYASTGDEAKTKAITEKLESDYRNNTYSNSNGILKSNYLEQLRIMYEDLSIFAFARDKRNTILQELASMASEVEAALTEHKFEHVLTPAQQKAFEDYREWIFKDEKVTGHSVLSVALQKIALNFLPTKGEIEDSFEKRKRESPMLFIFKETIIGDGGFKIAELGDLVEDRQKYLNRHYAEELHFNEPMLSMVLTELVKRNTADEVFEELVKGLSFKMEDELQINRLLTAFWEKDYVVTAHLALPLIEDSFRELNHISNRPIIKPNPDGGFDYYSDLSRFIADECIESIFGEHGSDFQDYARVLLVERLGWNLRNNFAHGINRSSLLRPEAAERLIHLMIWLSLVRKQPIANEK